MNKLDREIPILLYIRRNDILLYPQSIRWYIRPVFSHLGIG